MTDPDAGMISYQYDSANRLTSLANPFDETMDSTYDPVGRLTRQDNENGTYLARTFDGAAFRPRRRFAHTWRAGRSGLYSVLTE
jgi:YD repeat-containing protein